MSPDKDIIFVPAKSPIPSDWYHSGPFLIIGGTDANVSTLLTT